ncbi:unnamed protein product [Rotaria magnacalcarata]|uniref:Reverse transcriptase domain-containing protein n=1 Tax=Rotaria magnacalcarata TaxID=392030 RepID=A0A816XDT7_9BILA|nr:unnamed protein product [Rotaria magnacalcarata]CAF3970707.1 unnamed protein product [Rotaria magnacalcarata]
MQATRDRYGDVSFLSIRKTEKLSIKIQKGKCDLEFLRLCIIYRLTPSFIKIKLWKKKTETSTQYKNFQFYCIKQEYTRRHKEIIKYQKELEILISHLKNNLQQIDFQQLQQFLHEKTKKVKVLTIEIHERKLQKLNKGPIGQNYETLKHKIIHNYSSYNLLPEEERLLCRGWDFCIENKISNFIDFKTDIEINTTKLEQHCHPSVFKNICRKIYNHSDKLITSIKKKNIRNISDEEFIALKKLKNNQDIIISKADKGNAIVILDKKDYIEKIHEILKLKQFITSHESSLIRKEKAMNAYLSILKKEKVIEKALFYQLHSTSSSLAVLYGQPKIHKLNYPLRPIISSVGAYNYELSKYLSNIIKNNRPTKSMSYIKDSFEFVKEIKNITNSNYQTMVSFDIENLYTNIPVHEAIEETLDILFKKEKNKGATIIPFNRTQFKKLLELAVCEVPFRFLNNTYIQQDGVAMGSPLAPILADIFISKLELKLNKFSINKPLIWKRYVDDVFCIFHNSQKISKFLISINKWHKNINFTLQNEEDDEIAFLDVLIIRDKTNNKYTTTLYKKPTNTNLYMLYESNQSRQYKIGLIRTLVIRILLICSTISHQETELNTLKTTLIHNGYPMHLIKRGIREANCIVNKMNNKKEVTQQPPTKKKIYFILPYYGNESLILTQKIKQICKNFIPTCHVQIGFRKTFSLKSIFLPIQKGHDETKKTKKLVYKLKCNNCENCYIGETNREKITRLKEHKKDIKKCSETSNIAKHVHDKNHSFKFDESETLALETNWKRRIVKESLCTEETHGQAINDVKFKLKVFQ